MARPISTKEKRRRIEHKVNSTLRSIDSTSHVIKKWGDALTIKELEELLTMMLFQLRDIRTSYLEKTEAPLKFSFDEKSD